ncbi:LysR Transcriptional regulator [Burkholderiales bacterium]|jgi:molybdate transport repressor ModE-like protein
MNNHRIDLASLRLLLAVAQTGSITQAANQCHLALGAASARLRQLEEVLGVTLLERQARGTQLTEAGRLVTLRARAIEQELSQMGVELEDHLRGVTGHVRVVANMSSIAAVLPADLAAFLQSHPGIRVDLSEHHSREIQSLVAEGQADIGVLSSDSIRSELRSEPYYQDQLLAAVPAQDPWRRIRHLNRDRLLEQDLILLQEGGAIAEWLGDMARSEGRNLRVRVRAKGFDALAELVAAGLGITVLPSRIAHRFSQLLPIRLLPLEGVQDHRTVSLCALQGGPLLPAARTLYDFLRDRHP